MKCPECALEMMIYGVKVASDGSSEVDHVCRNPQCARFDRRLEKKKNATATEAGEDNAAK